MQDGEGGDFTLGHKALTGTGHLNPVKRQQPD